MTEATRGWVTALVHFIVHASVPVQCKVDLSTTEPHIHHVVYVGRCGIPGKVGVQKVLLKVVEVESLRRQGVWSCHQVLGGRGWDGGLDLLRC